MVKETAGSDQNGCGGDAGFLVVLAADYTVHYVGKLFPGEDTISLLLQSDWQFVCISEFGDQPNLVRILESKLSKQLRQFVYRAHVLIILDRRASTSPGATAEATTADYTADAAVDAPRSL